MNRVKKRHLTELRWQRNKNWLYLQHTVCVKLPIIGLILLTFYWWMSKQ